MNILLLGLKGVGKTTLGKKLAGMIAYTFIDTDQEIYLRHKKSPQEIFSQKGEMQLRKIERMILQDLQRKNNCVIALGGGGFLPRQNQEIIKTMGIRVCLYMNKEALLKRWGSWPLICRKKEDFEEYFNKRMKALTALGCIWINAEKEHKEDLILKVCRGK